MNAKSWSQFWETDTTYACDKHKKIVEDQTLKQQLSFVTKKSLQWASIILPVSESLVYTENNYYSSKTLRFGYNYHLSNIKTPYKVIHNGLNVLDWVRDNEIIRNKTSFVTVLGKGKIKIKGVDLIIEVASRFPNSIFYLAGIENVKGYNIPKNIICKGICSDYILKYNNTYD